jgi:transposase
VTLRYDNVPYVNVGAMKYKTLGEETLDMSISEDLRNKVRRLFYNEHYTIHAISQSEGIHPDTVKGALNRPMIQSAGSVISEKTSILDAYKDEIKEKIEHYPKMCATRLLQILEDKGFRGSIITLRRYLRKIRPLILRQDKAHIFMIVNKGEQGQVDWAHFGELAVGQSSRKLYLFVMVLSWSRAIFAKYTFDMSTASFLALHEEAFQAFGGLPRIILYDNLKSVVLARRGDIIQFNKDALDFAGYYCFEPRACSPRRGNEKGRVERSIRYIRDNFFCGRDVQNLEQINQELTLWLKEKAFEREWPDDKKISVRDAFEQEVPFLLPLAKNLFHPKRMVAVSIGKRPYARFDGNQYSVPPECVGLTLSLSATDKEVVIFRTSEIVATHDRCWEKEKIIEDQKHMAALREIKRSGRVFVGREIICRRIQSANDFIGQSLQLGYQAESTVRHLEKLSHQYSDEVVDLSLQRCLQNNTPTIEAARHYAHCIENELGIPTEASIHLPNIPEVKNLITRSHRLESYDLKFNKDQ